jgi:tripartite-type tricarboxylate transporter receptor subunit TctC
MSLRGIVSITALLIEMAVTVPVQAAAAGPEQAYPNKPIRLVEPQAAGSSVDVVARMIAERLTGILGQQVIVDNRAGASGLIGSELVAKAPRDGYTQAIVKALAAPDLRENLVNQGAEVVASSPEQFARFLREDLERWRKVITDAGVKAE